MLQKLIIYITQRAATHHAGMRQLPLITARERDPSAVPLISDERGLNKLPSYKYLDFSLAVRLVRRVARERVHHQKPPPPPTPSIRGCN